eukprot:m.53309 g.53309  ORF g.53309 m.53309 type:complete len:53 (+) comp13549_c0_seq5:620-778(+)
MFPVATGLKRDFELFEFRHVVHHDTRLRQPKDEDIAKLDTSQSAALHAALLT